MPYLLIRRMVMEHGEGGIEMCRNLEECEKFSVAREQRKEEIEKLNVMRERRRDEIEKLSVTSE